MSRDEEKAWTLEEERAGEAVRGLPLPAADAGFRERLRREFRSGEFTGRGGAWWPWAAAAVLVLAAGAAVAFATREVRWKVVVSEGAGSVVVDGRTLPVADAAGLAEALGDGARLETDARTEIQLHRDDTLALVVTPGSVVRIPAAPRRWWWRSAPRAVVERGELRGVTGRRFSGHVLRVALPEATAEVTGTTFAAFRNAEGSCVCVLEGVVSMSGPAGGPSPVTPLQRRVVPPGGDPARTEPIRPMERMKLEMLRDRAREMWAAPVD